VVGHDVGTQNYVCLLADSDGKFAPFTLEATLFGDDDETLPALWPSARQYHETPGSRRTTPRGTSFQHGLDASSVRGDMP
jgi:hypothetical protein